MTAFLVKKTLATLLIASASLLPSKSSSAQGMNFEVTKNHLDSYFLKYGYELDSRRGTIDILDLANELNMPFNYTLARYNSSDGSHMYGLFYQDSRDKSSIRSLVDTDGNLCADRYRSISMQSDRDSAIVASFDAITKKRPVKKLFEFFSKPFSNSTIKPYVVESWLPYDGLSRNNFIRPISQKEYDLIHTDDSFDGIFSSFVKYFYAKDNEL